MGSLCSAFNCLTEEVVLTTPFGSCTCGRSACSCVNQRETSDQLRQRVLADEVQKAVKVQFDNVEQLMKTAITNNLNKFGVIPVIHVLERGVASPPAALRSLTVRVSQPLVEEVMDEMKEAFPVLENIAKVAGLI